MLTTYLYLKIFWILLFNTKFPTAYLRNVLLVLDTLESFVYSTICFLSLKFQMPNFSNWLFYRFNKTILLFDTLDEN